MNLPGRAREPARVIRDVAADWVARSNGELSAVESAELRTWLAADSRHAAAFSDANAMWLTLNRPRHAGTARPVLQALAKAHRQQVHQLKVRAFAAATLTTAAVFAFLLSPSDSGRADRISPTVAVSPDRQVLPDGSVAELNAGAAIAVAYTAGVRGIHLIQGEVLFTVAHDAAHPFVVVAGDIEVRAIGTAFSVRSEPTLIDVLVTEGRVAVEQAAGTAMGPRAGLPRSSLELTAGSNAVIPLETISASEWNVRTLGAIEIKAALAWRERRFEFTQTPLNEALELFNRQNRLQLSLGDAALRDRRITGIFWSDDPEGFARSLAAGLNLKAERSLDVVVLRKL